MNGESFFDQLRMQLDQLEKNARTLEGKVGISSKQESSPTNDLMSEYNDVLEQEFIKDKKGQEFAKIQFEAAQRYLIMMFMNTPEGRKLSEERDKAFREYRDEKLKSFLESKKKGDKGNADVSQ